ncbi:hypothetical protein pEaSNUABM52_00200 [Erwinia phage pEp_SNUABM_52]|nr:hypothetical protein pEaSNUABM52_00200 [Erwinia phage pEp_SNUABM_52]
MKIFVSLAATQMNAQALTKVVGFRVLDHRLLREDNGVALYAFVSYAQGDTGDYEVQVAQLIRKGLSTNSYKLKNITSIADNFQSVFDASTTMEKLSPTGKFMSLSAPPPIQSAVFQLTDFKIPFSAGLQDRVDSWGRCQGIAPIRYAVVNPRTLAIEVAFQDASAHNSDIIQNMMRDSLYAALGDYSAGKNFDAPARALV